MEFRKDSTDDTICRAAKETQRTDFWSQWEKVRVGCMETVTWKLTLPYVK